MITQRDINTIQHVVFDSGAAEKFEAALRKSKAGRPSNFRPSLFLVGMLLAAQMRKHIFLTDMHKALTEELPLETQFAWGIRKADVASDGTPDIWLLSIDDLQNVSRAVLARLNYSKQRCPDRQTPGDMSDERARRYEAITDIMDTLISATLIPRPQGAEDYALDGSGLWANERAQRAIPKADLIFEDEDHFGLSGSQGADSDEYQISCAEAASATSEAAQASTGKRKRPGKGKAPRSAATRRPKKGGPSDADYGAKTGKNGQVEVFYGYELHGLVRAPESRATGAVRLEPALIERVRLTPAGRDVVQPSLEAIDSLLASGQPIKHLLIDRHYSMKKWDRWLQQLIRRGIEQVVDLRADSHGFKEWDGTLIAAGHPHCPATPTSLGTIPKPDLQAEKQEWDEFYSLIDERFAYAADITAPLNINGALRGSCPALSGKIGCPLRAGTIDAARQLNLPIVVTPPDAENAPRICTQNSFGLRVTTPEQGTVMKIHQKHYWGSRKQKRIYDRRTYVEGWFGTFKGDTAAAKKRGGNMFVGLAHASLDATIFAVVTNLITVRKWHEETGLGDDNHPLLHEPPERFTHRRLTATEYRNYELELANEAA